MVCDRFKVLVMCPFVIQKEAAVGRAGQGRARLGVRLAGFGNLRQQSPRRLD
jgi:hypothetical protein